MKLSTSLLASVCLLITSCGQMKIPSLTERELIEKARAVSAGGGERDQPEECSCLILMPEFVHTNPIKFLRLESRWLESVVK